MKALALLLLSVALRGQTFTPTEDERTCQRIECTQADAGSPTLRASRRDVRNIYHELFDYVDGVMTIQRPIKVVEAWRTAGDSEYLPDGSICRHSACFHPAQAVSNGRRDDDEPSPPPKPKGISAEPESACGMDRQHPTANIDLIHVACVNYDELRARMPAVTFTASGWATQVIVHVRSGTVAYISVNGGKSYKRAPLSLDTWGRMVALVEFRRLHAAKDIVVRVAEERE